VSVYITQNITKYTITQTDENRFLVQRVIDKQVIDSREVVNQTVVYDEVKCIKNRFTAGETMGGHKVVYMYDGKVWVADNTNDDIIGRVIGMSNQAANESATVEVILQGEITLNLWGLVPNSVYYLGTDGAITASVPAGTLYKIGVAKDANTLIINHNLLIERN